MATQARRIIMRPRSNDAGMLVDMADLIVWPRFVFPLSGHGKYGVICSPDAPGTK